MERAHHGRRGGAVAGQRPPDLARANEIKPHVVKTFKVSTDPQFAEKFCAGACGTKSGSWELYGDVPRLSPEHLHRYVAEFKGRDNVRDFDTIDQIAGGVRGWEGKRLRYPDLIAHRHGRRALAVSEGRRGLLPTIRYCIRLLLTGDPEIWIGALRLDPDLRPAVDPYRA